jgi:nucleotide-binding universal stress UspA family protein
MYNHIMVPVDLRHADHLTRALQVAAALGKQFDAQVTYVGVTPETPTSMGHNPQEFEEHLKEFAQSEAGKHGHKADAKGYPSHDPAIDLNDTLLKAADDLDADLIVMQSHIPNLADHLWPSHGGQVAKRAHASVFVVR